MYTVYTLINLKQHLSYSTFLHDFYKIRVLQISYLFVDEVCKVMKQRDMFTGAGLGVHQVC